MKVRCTRQLPTHAAFAGGYAGGSAQHRALDIPFLAGEVANSLRLRLWNRLAS